MIQKKKRAIANQALNEKEVASELDFPLSPLWQDRIDEVKEQVLKEGWEELKPELAKWKRETRKFQRRFDIVYRDHIVWEDLPINDSIKNTLRPREESGMINARVILGEIVEWAGESGSWNVMVGETSPLKDSINPKINGVLREEILRGKRKENFELVWHWPSMYDWEPTISPH